MVILFSIATSCIVITIASWWAFQFMKTEVSHDKIREISGFIRASAKAYLAREYRTISFVAIGIFIVLFFALGWSVAIGFLIGAVASALAGYIGMTVSVHANAATAEVASTSEASAFSTSFRSGAVTGLMVAGLALLVLSLFYFFTKDLAALVGLGFGGSLLSVFARIGGGIFTKAADVGADLVGKVEAGIPEDDPRNPAVIADNVGDNVGDCAGMAADIFETYIVSVMSCMLLGSLLFPDFQGVVLFPLAIGSVGVVATLLAIFLTKIVPYTTVMKSLYIAVGIAAILAAIFLFPVTSYLINGNMQYSLLEVYGAILVGFGIVAGMLFITDYYTSKRFPPVRRIARSSLGGHATNIIIGLAVGFEATAAPVILLGIGILLSFWFAGIYGVALAVMGMLSLAGIVVTMDAFGPVADNAGGIAEMAGLPEETRKATDSLDAAAVSYTHLTLPTTPYV